MLLGSTSVKAEHEYVGEIDPRSHFHRCFMSSFYTWRFQMWKETVKPSMTFWVLGTYECKNCSKNVDEIETRFLIILLTKSEYRQPSLFEDFLSVVKLICGTEIYTKIQYLLFFPHLFAVSWRNLAQNGIKVTVF